MVCFPGCKWKDAINIGEPEKKRNKEIETRFELIVIFVGTNIVFAEAIQLIKVPGSNFGIVFF